MDEPSVTHIKSDVSHWATGIREREDVAGLKRAEISVHFLARPCLIAADAW
jgi:hypothetical protein